MSVNTPQANSRSWADSLPWAGCSVITGTAFLVLDLGLVPLDPVAWALVTFGLAPLDPAALARVAFDLAGF